MEQLMDYLDLNLPVFLLIFARISAFFVSAPLFSYRNIPILNKIIISAALAFFASFTIDIEKELAIDWTYFLLIIKEAMVGVGIGLVAMLILYAVQVAGGLIDFQMGFAIANVVDPQTGIQTPLLGQFFYVLALLFLLSVDGHLILLDGIFHSYAFIPVDKWLFPFADGQVAKHITQAFVQMFIIAFQMAVPVVASLFLVDIALGFIARTVPQVNVFVVGLPLKIFVSFVVLLVSFSVLFSMVNYLFTEMFTVMRTLMRLAGGV